MAIVGEDNDPMRAIIANSVKETMGVDPSADPALEDDGVDVDAEGEADADAGAADDSARDTAAVGADGAAEADSAVASTVDETAKVVEPEKVAAGATKPADKVAVDAAAKTAKDKKTDDAFAKEHGVKSTDAMGRPNRIPYPVVRDRIVPNAIKRAKAEWETAVLAPERNKVKVYEDRLGSIEQTEKIMFERPRQYLAMLAAGVPGYSQLFDELRGGKAVVEGKEEAKRGDGTNLAVDANDPEPQPDVRNDKGEPSGYTQRGLADLRAWDRRQAAKEGAKAATDALEKRFAPLMSREEQTQANQQLNQTVDAVITSASAWPGFQENHAAILDELAKGKDTLDTGPKMHRALQEAYNTVMFGAVTKHKETEEETRDRYFAEFQTSLRKAPRSAAAISTVRRGEPAAGDDADVSSDDRMRNIIAGVASKLK